MQLVRHALPLAAALIISFGAFIVFYPLLLRFGYEHGVVLGAATDTSIKIWVRSLSAERARVVYRPALSQAMRDPSAAASAAADVLAEHSTDWVPIGHDTRTAVIALTGLQPLTPYDYRVQFKRSEGDAEITLYEERATFTTLPSPHDARTITFVFSSCVRAGPPWPFSVYSIFEYIKRFTHPQFMILLGDTAYSDLPRMPLERAYELTFGDPGGLRVIAPFVPTFSQYDDHEISVLDVVCASADGGSPAAAAEYASSMRHYDNWIHSRNPVSPVSGEYFYSFAAGSAAFFVLDTRKHAAPYDTPDGPLKTKLGAVQRRALLEWLTAVNATYPFKFIASPVSWASSVKKPTVNDGWAGYTYERNVIFDFIEQQRILGVILLSGDLHFAHVTQFRSYRSLFEASASPIAHLPLGWFLRQTADESVLFSSILRPHFGVVKVTGGLAPRVVLCIWAYSFWWSEPELLHTLVLTPANWK